MKTKILIFVFFTLVINNLFSQSDPIERAKRVLSNPANMVSRGGGYVNRSISATPYYYEPHSSFGTGSQNNIKLSPPPPNSHPAVTGMGVNSEGNFDVNLYATQLCESQKSEPNQSYESEYTYQAPQTELKELVSETLPNKEILESLYSGWMVFDINYDKYNKLYGVTLKKFVEPIKKRILIIADNITKADYSKEEDLRTFPLSNGLYAMVFIADLYRTPDVTITTANFNQKPSNVTGIENVSFTSENYIESEEDFEIIWLTANTKTSEDYIDIEAFIKSSTKPEVKLRSVQKGVYLTSSIYVTQTNAGYIVRTRYSLDEGRNDIVLKATISGLSTVSDILSITKEMGGDKIAYLFGFSEYNYLASLNGENDVNTMAQNLKSLNWDVLTFNDLTGEQMRNKLKELNEKVNGNNYSKAMIYASGHGFNRVQDSKNYIAAIDASQTFCTQSDLSVDELLASINVSETLEKIVIVDACRDTLSKFINSPVGPWKSMKSSNLPQNTLIMYSCGFNQRSLAEGNQGSISIFTESITKYIKESLQTSFTTFFGWVKEHTLRFNRNQEPEFASSMQNDFTF